MFGQRWRLMSPWLTDSFSWETVDGKRKETGFLCPLGFPGGSVSKESACKAGDLGWIPGLDPWVGKISLEKEMATHSRILAWKIPMD